MAGQLTNSSVTDMITLRQYYADVMIGGKWAGEDVIAMMAGYLRRKIHVFMYVGADGTSPTKYLPVSPATKPPLLIAFYEPGHYRCGSKCYPLPARELSTQNPAPCNGGSISKRPTKAGNLSLRVSIKSQHSKSQLAPF